MQGFVGHDRILVVLAVILAKETLFDRTQLDFHRKPLGGLARRQPSNSSHEHPPNVCASIVRAIGCSP
ncbi:MULTISPECIES: hypothetical protein [unclassified Microcoleus]|uniref:hypothetical protein n=1 Tax=unclassified Microcoleus TaxID=2642155 RepID=UPI002FD45340